MKYVKINFIIFIIFYLFIVLVFSFTSYKFFIKDFIVLEKNQNQNNINTLLITLNLRMDNIKSIAHDYGGWDDTYHFIEGKNSDYIYDNFREGIDTLENLNLDFIIFSNLKDNIAFSQYTIDILKKNRVEFEKELLKNLIVEIL